MALGGLHVGEAQAGVIINGDEQELLTCALDRGVAVAGDAVTHALDARELLGVDMDPISGVCVLVAQHRCGGLLVAQVRPAVHQPRAAFVREAR